MEAMKIVEIKENAVIFDNGFVMLSIHWMDCCESVYADFSYIKQYNSLGKHANKNIFEVKFMTDFYHHIVKVKGEGFIIKTTDRINNSIFVPCYNIQNGHYSDNLELLIFDNNIAKLDDFSNQDIIEDLNCCERIDITECHTERYY